MTRSALKTSTYEYDLYFKVPHNQFTSACLMDASAWPVSSLLRTFSEKKIFRQLDYILHRIWVKRKATVFDHILLLLCHF